MVDDGDSSPDLSLKLRRGSSDSRDSFYMDFDKGIDSDIEEIATTSSAADPFGRAGEDAIITTITTGTADATATTPNAILLSHGNKIEMERWPITSLSCQQQSIMSAGSHSTTTTALGGVDPLLTLPSSTIINIDTLGQQQPSTSLKKSKRNRRRRGHVQIIATPPLSSGDIKSPAPGLLTVAPLGYHHHHNHQQFPTNTTIIRRQSRAEKQIEWRQLGADALATTLSALYGKLLVVMGTAFPMAEVISTYIPPSFYEAYYLYLYIGSMFFLLYMYTVLLRDKRMRKNKENNITEEENNIDISRDVKDVKEESITISSDESDTTTGDVISNNSSSAAANTITTSQIYNTSNNSRRNSLINSTKQNHYGSFYLRMGAVAFGIGSMIYSGLEFGQYFELERDTKCHNVLLALTPATRMVFIFIQMYFIFLNNEQMSVYKHKVAARFGLMHMIGTNLSVWLNVLVQETKHEILTFYNPENNSLRISHRIPYKSNILLGLPIVTADHPAEAHHRIISGNTQHIVARRGLKGPHHLYECRRTNIIGSLVQDASPFLFPCTIEYSLICAAILYVMWRSISKLPITINTNNVQNSKYNLNSIYNNNNNKRRSPHHYSVDCARAHKGLFVGILLLVLTIISLILFFVLISRAEFVGLAVIEVNICELTLYGLTTLASILGMWQVRQLKYDGSKNLQLDNILLIGAQTGMFVYSTFTIIGGQFTIQRNTVLVLVTALASLLQTTCQTIFILDASRRSCVTPAQIRHKPGRELVTFLLVTNLAMWAINTLEKSRAESHPIQLHFYGLWAWTIITHVSMPLAIFYRFHSTVCLCEIWKRAYKIKPAYM